MNNTVIGRVTILANIGSATSGMCGTSAQRLAGLVSERVLHLRCNWLLDGIGV